MANVISEEKQETTRIKKLLERRHFVFFILYSSYKYFSMKIHYFIGQNAEIEAKV